MIEQLKTIREALEQAKQNTTHGQIAWNCKEAITALSELERMAVGQEPVDLDHIACIDDGELRYMTGRKAPAYGCELYAMPDGKRAPKLYAAPPAQQYEAGDMASAHNDGFRAGVASVAQQPQAEAVPKVQIVNCDTCKHAKAQPDDYPCNRCGVEFGDGPFNRWEAPQQAEAVPSDVVALLQEARDALWQPSNPDLCSRIDEALAAQGEKP